jgi:cytochrome c oxidase subunit 4
MTKTGTARLTYIWIILCAITVVSWRLATLAHAGSHFVASVPVTLGVLAIGCIKARLIIQSFMEVRTAPTWLRLCTDGWLIVFWGSVLAIYLY